MNPPPPTLTECEPPKMSPIGDLTQARLVALYVDALSAWSVCSEKIKFVIRYYADFEKKEVSNAYEQPIAGRLTTSE